MLAKERGEPKDPQFEAEVNRAVEAVVADQVAAGIDVVSDGEMSKFSYTFYAKDRMKGITQGAASVGRTFHSLAGRDALEHPDYMDRFLKSAAASFDGISFPICTSDVSYGDVDPLRRDISRLKLATKKTRSVDAFMTAASPGVLVRFVANKHYATEEAYLAALAAALKTEYTEIVNAGFVLQIDCPDLASSRNTVYKDKTDDEFLRIAARNVEVLNHATEGIPSEAMRLRICWGNYGAPHTYDIPLTKIIEICFRARPSGISFEGANPRHEHEWEDLAQIDIPEDKILIPGVIDSTKRRIFLLEHPRLVAQRICRYARIVGRERVIAGTDCGFGTFASIETVAPSIAWAKLRTLAEGAGIASRQLWK